MKQLLTVVVPRIAVEWKIVAFMLYFDIYKVDLIEQKFRDNPEECCCNLLEEWIGTNQGVTPKNWITLLSLLREIKDLPGSIISDEIEEFLKQ